MTDNNPKCVFENMEPNDGFYVYEHDLGSMEITLQVGVRVSGEDASVLGRDDVRTRNEIWVAEKPERIDYGKRTRAKMLSESIVNYFNIGGDWAEFDQIVSGIAEVVKGGLVFPGYSLVDCFTDTDGNFTSVYCEEGADNVVCWVRDQFIDIGKGLNEVESEDEPD